MQLPNFRSNANVSGFVTKEQTETTPALYELEYLTEAVMLIKADFLSLLKNIPELREKIKRDN
ncbi:hypothetical protein [Foetidibacter luteolus]|uniref:hypothetical protein n=1 Tax=Foetidibacter luteolus TaxID=2608880 RepID=UPI00129AD2F7|nr:hypothetical protein [Foetidibacter luteolus]